MKLLSILAVLAVLGSGMAAPKVCVQDDTCGAACDANCEGDCDTAGPGKCDSDCADGYYLDAVADSGTLGTCVACPGAINAATCSDATTAVTCAATYFMDSGTCTACVVRTAAECGDGKQPLTNAACAAGSTAQLDDTTGCVACANAASTGGSCTACDDANALTCTTANTGVTCAAGYESDTSADACTACAGANEATCSSATVATSCNVGYFLASDQCTACVARTAAECGDGKKPLTADEGCPAVSTGVANAAAQLDDTTGCVACANAASTGGSCTPCTNGVTCETATKALTCAANEALVGTGATITCETCSDDCVGGACFDCDASACTTTTGGGAGDDDDDGPEGGTGTQSDSSALLPTTGLVLAALLLH